MNTHNRDELNVSSTGSDSFSSEFIDKNSASPYSDSENSNSTSASQASRSAPRFEKTYCR